MRTVKIFMLAAIFGWSFSTTQVVGNDTGLLQASTDSIIAPTVFTPNGDGINDFFEVKSREGNPVLLKVFSRDGKLVFCSKEAKMSRWDGRSPEGKELPQGTYFYVAEVTAVEPKITANGTVALVR